MFSSTPRNARRSPGLLSAAVTLVSLALTLSIWVREQRTETEAHQAAVIREIALISVELRDRLNSHALFLRSIRAFFASTPEVSPEQWRSFTRQLDIERHAPGLEAYGYAQRVNAETPPPFGAAQPPAADFDAPFRLIHIAPLAERVQKALGNDILSEKLRHIAAEQARDTDDVVLTGRTTLRIDASALPQPSLLMLMPVYLAGSTTRTVTERRAAITGLVSAAYRMSSLVDSLHAARDSELALRIYDVASEGQGEDGAGLTLLFDSFPEGAASTPLEEREFYFGQRKWLLQFQPKTELPWLGESSLLLAGGLIITLLLALLTWNLATRRLVAEAYARQVNADLLHSEKRFQLVTQGTDDGLWDHDLASGDVYFSTRLEQLIGFTPGTLARDVHSLFLRIHPDDVATVRAAGLRHLQERVPYDIEFRVLKADGHWGWFRACGQAVWNDDGRAIRMAGSLSDVSRRKEAEAQLEHYKNFLATVLRSIPLPVFVKDCDSRFIMANAAMCALANTEERKLIGVRELANAPQAPETEQKIRAMDERVFSSGGTQIEEYTLAIPGRGLRNLIARKTLATAPDGAPIMIGTLTDMTEQRTAEKATLRSNRKLQAILDATTEVSIISTDTAGLIRTFNRGAEKMLAYSASEMIGRQSPSILHLGSEITQRSNELSSELGYPVAGFDVFIAHPLHNDAERREWTYLRRDGSRIAVNLVVTAVHDEAGEISGYLGIALDITERLRAEAELRRHRDHLRELVAEQTSELLHAKETAELASATKSEFLANMSHELRTPMHAVLGFAELGEDKSRALGAEKLQHYFERIRQSGERLLTLLNDLLDLSKLEAGKMPVELARHDVLACLHDAAGELEPLLANRRQRLLIEAPACPTEAICDPVRLGQVFRNLLSNAIKFSPEQGTITVSFSPDTLPAGRRTGDHAALPALRITVADEGPGIPPDELDAIFDKFMQSSKTKSGAGGTGLGLAICREILDAHRGTIRACNNSAGGAAFTVLLPLIPNPLLPTRSRKEP